MFLVDTNILSGAAPGKARPQPELADWLTAASPLLYLSVVTLAEVEAGIAKAGRIGASAKAASLDRWRSAIEHLYADRILVFDRAAALVAGQILDRARAHDPGFEDIVIAATAAAHNLTVLTANERHFSPLGVPFANPLKKLPKLP